jgi:hypothetical protein
LVVRSGEHWRSTVAHEVCGRPTRARARSPQATTPIPHALKISRGDDDGDPAALHGAFDAVE